MNPPLSPTRLALGTMIAYGCPGLDLEHEFELASRLGATHLEILPDWGRLPDPASLRERARELGYTLHSVHGCWGGRSIAATRVDLGSIDERVRQDSRDDIRRCLDWIEVLGARHLVVHPGGLSAPEDARARRDALARSLTELARSIDGSDLRLCVENMPPGVHPGSRMIDLYDLVDDLDLPSVALALDTGHAHISTSVARETLDAGDRLATTHVHDNDGRKDSHHPPGHGSVDWNAFATALSRIGYEGPIVLECIRHLRRHPGCLDEALRARLDQLTAAAVAS